MAAEQRILRVTFPSPESFQTEYAANLVNGGVYVAGESGLDLRERVAVELCLPFCGQTLTLEGEVVHQVPPELAGSGATPGVAIQLAGSAAELRQRLEPLARACEAAPPPEPRLGRRDSPRVPARVAARIDGPDEVLGGHTRDLSRSGVLIDAGGRGLPVGQSVKLTLEHPLTGEAMRVEGRVARQVESGGAVSAVAVHFEPSGEEREQVHRFIETVQSAEHSRRLGGISGSLSELGPANLLAMLTGSAAAGTLAMRRGPEEGLVGFEAGLLRYVRLGAAQGMKALARMLGWEDGSFEFHARLEPCDGQEAPLPLPAALLEAVQLVDELARLDLASLSDEAVPRIAGGPAEAGDAAPGKLEQAVLDLAGAGATVRRIVDVVPEPDAQVYRALLDLLDRNLIRL